MKNKWNVTLYCAKASFVYTAPNKSAKGGAKLNPKRKKKSEEKKIFLTKVLRRFMGCNRGMKKNQAAWCGTWCIMSSTQSHLNEKPALMAKAPVCPILTKSDDMCCPNIKQHADTTSWLTYLER